MPRQSQRLAGKRAIEAEIARILSAARSRAFKRAMDDYGLRGNPFALKPLADRLGVHQSTLYGWERGRSRPDSLALMQQWAGVLGVSFSIILDGQRL